MTNLGSKDDDDGELAPDYSDLLHPLGTLPTEDDIEPAGDAFGIELTALTSTTGEHDTDEPLDVGDLLSSSLESLPADEDPSPVFGHDECAALLPPVHDGAEDADDERVAADDWSELLDIPAPPSGDDTGDGRRTPKSPSSETR